MTLNEQTPTTPVPTASSAGFVYSTGEGLDRLISYYITSDKNQSEIFRGQIYSMPHTISMYQQNPSRLCSEIELELTTFLSNYFGTVTVVVTYKDIIPDSDAGQYEIIMDIIAGNSLDEQQRLYKHARVEEGVLTNVFTYNNEGRMIKNDYQRKQNQTRTY